MFGKISYKEESDKLTINIIYTLVECIFNALILIFPFLFIGIFFLLGGVVLLLTAVGLVVPSDPLPIMVNILLGLFCLCTGAIATIGTIRAIYFYASGIYSCLRFKPKSKESLEINLYTFNIYTFPSYSSKLERKIQASIEHIVEVKPRNEIRVVRIQSLGASGKKEYNYCSIETIDGKEYKFGVGLLNEEDVYLISHRINVFLRDRANNLL